jgi:hypothetical protein
MKLAVILDDGQQVVVCEDIEQRDLNPMALSGQLTLREIEYAVHQFDPELDPIWGKRAEMLRPASIPEPPSLAERTRKLREIDQGFEEIAKQAELERQRALQRARNGEES